MAEETTLEADTAGPRVHLRPRGPMSTTPGGALNTSALRLDQIHGWDCALCGQRLYADRSIGVHDVTYGPETVSTELFACAPDCETTKPPTGRQS